MPRVPEGKKYVEVFGACVTMPVMHKSCGSLSVNASAGRCGGENFRRVLSPLTHSKTGPRLTVSSKAGT